MSRKSLVERSIDEAEKELDRLVNLKNSVEAQAGVASKTLAKIKGSLEKLTEELETKKDEESSLGAKVVKLVVKTAEAEAEHSKVARSVVKAASNLLRLEDSIESAKDVAVVQREEVLSEAKAKLEALEAEAVLVKADLEVACKDVEGAKAKLAELKEKQAAARLKGKGEVGEVREVVTELKHEVGVLKKQKGRLEDEVADIEVVKKELKLVEGKLGKVTEECAKAEKDLVKSIDKKAKVEAEVDRKTGGLKKLEFAIDVKTVKVQKLVEEGRANKYFKENKII